MSLISLNNGTQTTGRFTSTFKESITIPKDSKIALLNASLELEDNLIVVTTKNNTFQFKTANTSDVLNVILTPNTYNIKNFLSEITKQMNSVLQYDNTAGRKSNRGFQCKASISDDRKLSISTAMTNQQTPLAWKSKFETNFDVVAPNYTKDTADNWDAGSATNRYFTDGCGAVYATMPTKTNKYCIGLVDSNIESDYDGDFSPDNYMFAVYNELRDGVGPDMRYYVKITNSDGTITTIQTDVEGVDNDIVGLMLEEGKLKFFANGAGDIPTHSNLFLLEYALENFDGTIDWQYGTSYYCMFSAFTDGTVIYEPVFYYDPYHKVTAEMVKYPHFKEGNQYELDPDEDFLGLGASIMTLILPDAVQKLFGFTSNPLPSPNTTIYTFEAQKSLPEASVPSNIRVIVENMRLDSYNSRTGKRESILMTIPTVLFEDFKVSFERQNPIYININNKDQFVLNNITIRIEDFEGNLLPMKPNLGDITILID